MNNAGLARVGHARAWPGSVRYGLVWRGAARCGTTWLGGVGSGALRWGMAWCGQARYGTAWFLLLGCLSACTSVPIISPPQIVTTTHTVYQPIPAAYLQHCLLPIGTPPQNGNLLELEQEAVRYLMDCNKQLDRIKTLAPPATTHQ